jgi:3-hydroxybutyryl-CoA dehydrogenase
MNYGSSFIIRLTTIRSAPNIDAGECAYETNAGSARLTAHKTQKRAKAEPLFRVVTANMVQLRADENSMTAHGIRTAAVAGAGTMGAGIAITIARGGFKTILYDNAQAALDRAKPLIEAFFSKSVERGKLSRERSAEIIANLSFTSDITRLGNCDFVVEAIFEDIPMKCGLYAQLEKVCPPHTVFASNASTLSITQLAAGCGRPDRFVGMHYCLPAQVMKLIEMSRGIYTSEQTWDIAWQFALATGQHPVETRDTPGFILNYFCVPYHNDVIRIIEAGVAAPADIDRAMKRAFDFAMGPCELLDMIGLDTHLRGTEAFFAITNNPRLAPPPLLRRMVAAGLLGRKTKRGFYEYESAAMFGG